MKALLPAFLLLTAGPAVCQVAHMRQPLLDETAAQISEHVWVITGFPNIGIVVGSCATLVVDTGLGARSTPPASPVSPPAPS